MSENNDFEYLAQLKITDEALEQENNDLLEENEGLVGEIEEIISLLEERKKERLKMTDKEALVYHNLGKKPEGGK